MLAQALRKCQLSFNSRPHAEVDFLRSDLHPVKLLSTHDLTQRSTCHNNLIGCLRDLSTHDLTQRSTW